MQERHHSHIGNVVFLLICHLLCKFYQVLVTLIDAHQSVSEASSIFNTVRRLFTCLSVKRKAAGISIKIFLDKNISVTPDIRPSDLNNILNSNALFLTPNEVPACGFEFYYLDTSN